jgi:HD-GYP domain-containing protein (c-di-GMP phosphodiesterase class II)
MLSQEMCMCAPIESERSERQSRLTAAFVDAAIATSGALDALLATVYRALPDRLAHFKRVAWLVVRIGRELKLSDQALQDLERAALVHDLGRLVITDPAHTSPITMDLDEPTEQLFAAAAIVSAVPFLARGADIVLASRECIDGSGLPFGLVADAISLEARILHVADAFDNLSIMCSRFGVHPETVAAEMSAHAGTRFDADVVAACLRCRRIGPSPLAQDLRNMMREGANGHS